MKKFVFLLCIGLLGIPSLVQSVRAEADLCITDPLCSTRYTSQGHDKKRAKDYKGALVLFNKSNAHRKNVNAYEGIAETKLLMGDKDGAYAAMREVDMVSYRAYKNYNGSGLSLTSLMTANAIGIPRRKVAK